MIRSCNYHAQAIRHIRDLLDQSTAHKLACGLILSILDYSKSLLYGTPIEAVSKLQRLQNNVARIVDKADRRCDARPLLQQLHWLPVESRLQFKIALLTYKVRSTSTPPYLSSLITAKRPTGHSLRSSSVPQLTIPSGKTEFARRAFRVTASQIWNDLPVNVQSIVNLFMFLNRD